jgi:hypothetical protein
VVHSLCNRSHRGLRIDKPKVLGTLLMAARPPQPAGAIGYFIAKIMAAPVGVQAEPVGRSACLKDDWLL